MKNEYSPNQKKLRLLGNVLMALACLGLIASVISVPLGIYLSSPTAVEEIKNVADELLLPAGITKDTTVRELLEKDHAFFKESTTTYRLVKCLAASFYFIACAIFLLLALAWRQAEPFGRPTIIGLRWLGLLFIVQSVSGWGISNFIPRAEHSDLLFFSAIYQESVDFLVGGSATLLCGILFLILSWVLEYGRGIKAEQALTI